MESLIAFSLGYCCNVATPVEKVGTGDKMYCAAKREVGNKHNIKRTGGGKLDASHLITTAF